MIASNVSLPSFETQRTSSGTYMYTGDAISLDKQIIDSNGNDVIIGDLSMTKMQFELCMKHLLELTKSKYPEEFL